VPNGAQSNTGNSCPPRFRLSDKIQTGALPLKAHQTEAALFHLVVLGLRLLLLLLLLLLLRRCRVFLFRDTEPGLRYVKQDRPFICVLDFLGSVQALLGVLPKFFHFARHGGLTRRYRIRNIVPGLLVGASV
jgi:hypothetical protein